MTHGITELDYRRVVCERNELQAHLWGMNQQLDDMINAFDKFEIPLSLAELRRQIARIKECKGVKR